MSCPNTWPKPVILRLFRELILDTWTVEEILAVQRLTEFDALPPRVTESTMESLPIMHPARLRGKK